MKRNKKLQQALDMAVQWRADYGTLNGVVAWRITLILDGERFSVCLDFGRRIDCEMACRVLNEKQITYRQLCELDDQERKRVFCEHLQW